MQRKAGRPHSGGVRRTLRLTEEVVRELRRRRWVRPCVEMGRLLEAITQVQQGEISSPWHGSKGAKIACAVRLSAEDWAIVDHCAKHKDVPLCQVVDLMYRIALGLWPKSTEQ